MYIHKRCSVFQTLWKKKSSKLCSLLSFANDLGRRDYHEEYNDYDDNAEQLAAHHTRIDRQVHADPYEKSEAVV